MSHYRHGVLIHNYNEDRFGKDSLQKPKVSPPTGISTTHKTLDWKQPSQEKRDIPPATQSLEGHILFGHSGDMRDPRNNFQKRSFGPSSQYFFQDPGLIESGAVEKPTQELFVDTEAACESSKKSSSVLADKIKQRWVDDKDTLRSTYVSTYNKTIAEDSNLEEGDAIRHESHHVRPTAEFSNIAHKLYLARQDGKR